MRKNRTGTTGQSDGTLVVDQFLAGMPEKLFQENPLPGSDGNHACGPEGTSDAVPVSRETGAVRFGENRSRFIFSEVGTARGNGQDDSFFGGRITEQTGPAFQDFCRFPGAVEDIDGRFGKEIILDSGPEIVGIIAGDAFFPIGDHGIA